MGTLIVGVRGTVGGATFSANKAGPYAKVWNRGSNPRTQRQLFQRNSLVQPSAGWRALSAANKTAWNTFAALPAQQLTNTLGVAYYISGFAWYVKLSTNLILAGAAPIATAPVLAVPAVPDLTSYSPKATGAASQTRVGFNAASPTLGMLKAVFQVVGNSAGASVPPTRMQLMTIANVVGTLISIQTPTEQRYGTIVAGQRGYVSTRNQNAEGRRSPEQVFYNFIFTTP
jgi:hypothetical protein